MRNHLDAAGAEGNLDVEYGACCVVWVGGDPHPLGQGALPPLEPLGQGGDLRGRIEAPCRS